MKTDSVLEKAVMRIVNAQLRENDPKATKETLERLLKEGRGETEAKELIASVLIEEMRYMLKNGQEFDEERFAKRLAESG